MSSTTTTTTTATTTPPTPLQTTIPPYTEPLYTEIRIPLPPLPTTSTPTSKSKSKPALSPRPRAHTLHTLSPFHRRRDSGASPDPDAPASPPTRKLGDSRASVFSFRRGRGESKRGVDALAVAPAMLVLKAELFTPEERVGERGEWAEMVEGGKEKEVGG